MIRLKRFGNVIVFPTKGQFVELSSSSNDVLLNADETNSITFEESLSQTDVLVNLNSNKKVVEMLFSRQNDGSSREMFVTLTISFSGDVPDDAILNIYVPKDSEQRLTIINNDGGFDELRFKTSIGSANMVVVQGLAYDQVTIKNSPNSWT